MGQGLVLRAVLASVLLASLIGGGFAVLLIAVDDLRNSGRQALRARAELAAAEALERSLIDLETGERGFVITAEERFLEPWREARRAYPRQAERMIGLAASPEERRRSRRIAVGIDDYVHEYSIPLIGAVRRGDPSASSIATTEEGKERVDVLRGQFERLIARERSQITSEQESTDSDAEQAIAFAMVGLIGSVLLIGLMGTYMVRSIVLPIRRASSMAGRLAAGDLRARLSENGPGEIGALEHAFNQMGESLEQNQEELVASRARIVAAGDETRRRILRDLHDGAQQTLVRTVINLKLARRALGDEESEVATLMGEALAEAERANADLRELAHGILPAVLTRGGLRAGIESLTARMPLPVTVEVPEERLPRSLEATAYFIVAEALTNVVKHAHATRAEVHASLDGERLYLEVRDDGMGRATVGGGSGLVGLKDRAAAAGGQLRIDSRPGEGTLIVAVLPMGGG